MIRLEALTGRHDRKTFDSGVVALDRWLQQTAMQHQQRGFARTFVAVAADDEACQALRGYFSVPVDDTRILGFYALSSASVRLDDLPPALQKRYPRLIPVTRLGRLGIARELQGQGLGKLLLTDALDRVRRAAQVVGSAGVLVDAKDETVAGFYRSLGFLECQQDLSLFLPMESLGRP
jgi:GNAT superfamily N-acetyltransferase